MQSFLSWNCVVIQLLYRPSSKQKYKRYQLWTTQHLFKVHTFQSIFHLDLHKWCTESVHFRRHTNGCTLSLKKGEGGGHLTHSSRYCTVCVTQTWLDKCELQGSPDWNVDAVRTCIDFCSRRRKDRSGSSECKAAELIRWMTGPSLRSSLYITNCWPLVLKTKTGSAQHFCRSWASTTCAHTKGVTGRWASSSWKLWNKGPLKYHINTGISHTVCMVHHPHVS